MTDPNIPELSTAVLTPVPEQPTEQSLAADRPAPAPLQPRATPGDWIATLPDDALTFAQARGWASPPDVVESYRDLDCLLGRDAVPMPRDDVDIENLDRVYTALGRPDTPSGYDLPAPHGGDPAFGAQAAGWFHKAGLSPRQASMLMDSWNAHRTGQQAAEDEAMATRIGEEVAGLRVKWGENFDRDLSVARTAARRIGLEPDEVAGLERTLGLQRMMTTFHKIGDAMVTTPDHVPAVTSEIARNRIAELKADKAWSARYLAGDPAEVAKFTRTSWPMPIADPDMRPGLRLETLRLAHRHDQAPEQVIARAKTLEAYVLGSGRNGAAPAPSAPDTADVGSDRGLAFSVGEDPEQPVRRRVTRKTGSV